MFKVLRVEYDGVKIFNNNKFEMDFVATDNVTDKNGVYNVFKNIYTQNIISFVGLNATGKTSGLKLLKLMFSVLLNDGSLKDDSLKDSLKLLQNECQTKIIFVYKNKVYEYLYIIKRVFPETDEDIRYIFKDEILKSKNISSIKAKSELFLFDNNLIKEDRIKRGSKDKTNIRITTEFKRSEMQKDNQSKFLIKDYDNIFNNYFINTLLQNDFIKPTYIDTLISTDVNMFLIKNNNVPKEFLELFDDKIEYINKDLKNLNDISSNEDIFYEIKFKNADKIYKENIYTINSLLSSGTVKGIVLFNRIERILIDGGYLIVDELENHFNKKIINVILSMFLDETINKNGATLIFSTHYVELLDEINRLDNIYVNVVNKNNNLIDTVKLSDKVARKDLKKSDVFMSNMIKGTAPKFQSIKALKQYFRNSVSVQDE